ncbi:MAG: class I SAM-dependent methyltransferase [Bacteroidetes bacterium]|nr:class I SAM-dependent methyltransferase [Bacteroidota bacterium]MCW5896874.1 class I SAM-dependent methyltransferase [Bacteroidota bacterium]
MKPNPKDHFSKQSAEYAEYRPRYPKELFAYLASLTSEHELAVDCATGNGQAAVGLADYYGRVVALDQSPQQLAHAPRHPRITYQIGKAEALGVAPHTADLVAVAQALHWFSLDEFYAEARRVLKPAGILAVWTYGINCISPEIDTLVREYHDKVLEGYWPPERSHIIDGYRSLPFPFRELTPPAIEMQAEWTLEQLLGYLRSWSATQRYITATSKNPLNLIERALRKEWDTGRNTKRVFWPLTLRIGVVGEHPSAGG